MEFPHALFPTSINAYKTSIEKSRGKGPLGRPTRWWQDIIKNDLKKNRVGECGLHSSASAQRPFAGSCKHANEVLASIKDGEFLTSWTTVSFSSRTRKWTHCNTIYASANIIITNKKFWKQLIRLISWHYLTILHRVVLRLSQHNLKISHHRHV
jgi:hypothetical protein